MKRRPSMTKGKQEPSAVKLHADSDWIRDRRKLLRQVKFEVARRLGPEPADLQLLRRRYERELRRSWKVSDKADLLRAIESADVVYGGDFHASAQSQRTHLRILRSVGQGRPVVLGLECFARSAQRWIDGYLRGEISIDELRRRCHWDRRWGFPWENYRPLIEIAKRRNFRIIGLGDKPGSRAGGSIVAREKHAAAVILESVRKGPGALVYAIFGDLHLAPSGLPAAVKKLSQRKQALQEIVIHLNPERIYFDLARRGLEVTVDVVKLGTDRFCVMSSPPWLQWQSYLLHLERTQDESRPARPPAATADSLARKMREGRKGREGARATAEFSGETFDPTDQVAELVRLVARDLRVEARIALSELAVYALNDERALPSLERRVPVRDVRTAHWLLKSGRSFFLPPAGAGYLAQPSINHAATIAGQYLHAVLSGRKRAVWRLPGDFSRLIWVEATAYFASKLINHQRRSATVSDLKSEIASAVTGDDRGVEAMKLAMDRLVSELIFFRQGRLRAERLRPRRKSSYLDAARILGGMLGDRLYLALRSRKLKTEEIVSLLARDVTGKWFEADYQDILRTLQSIRVAVPVKSRPERL